VIQDLGRAVAPELLGKRTNDFKVIRRLVRTAVDYLRETMAKKLAPLSLTAVVRRCLDVLNSLHRDARIWDMSAAALFAIYPDREEILAEAHRQASKRDGTNSAGRVLIETALYSCHGGKEEVSDSTLDELLGLAQVLLRVADYDPPAVEKFPAGEISISKSGAFYIKNEFLDRLRQDYHRSAFEEGFFGAAKSYARHYHSETDASLPPDFNQFGVSLVSELGVDPEQVFRIGEALNRIGGERHEAVFLIRRSALESSLVAEGKISAEQAALFCDSITIFPRSAWDKDLPEGCGPVDVYPWRFMRKFSLLRRPIVQLELGDDPELLVSPVLVRDSLRYFISNSYEGNFPPNFFRSPEMCTFQDQAIARRSADFVRQIAEIMTKAGFHVETDISMVKLGAAAELGDVDVLAWRCGQSPEIRILECKALRNARSTADVLSQLRQFKGDAGDLLSKHLGRTTWLDTNRSGLREFTDLSDFALTGSIVTSHLVPMQFLPAADTRFGRFVDVESLRKQFPLSPI
jgi:hypothetical protein